MSRWSKRSKEEKERIYKETQQKRKKDAMGRILGKMHQEKEDSLTSQAMKKIEHSKNSEQASEVYRAGEIPLLCSEHGWVGSQQYRLYNDKHPMFGDQQIQFIAGRCKKCDERIMRAIPAPLSDEGMVFVAALTLLVQRDRVTDERKFDGDKNEKKRPESTS